MFTAVLLSRSLSELVASEVSSSLIVKQEQGSEGVIVLASASCLETVSCFFSGLLAEEALVFGFGFGYRFFLCWLMKRMMRAKRAMPAKSPTTIAAMVAGFRPLGETF